MEHGQLRIYKKDEVIYRQGEPSEAVFFILRGTVSVEVVKNDMGNLPVIIKILYDGQDFGEQVNLKESANVSKADIARLNQQKCTTKANEDDCFIFSFAKKKTESILQSGLQAEFDQILRFVASLDLFADQEMTILLPLDNSIVKKKYPFG